MFNRTRIIFLALLPLACRGGDSERLPIAAAAPPSLITITRDVEYGVAPALAAYSRQKKLKLDVYQPAATSRPHPAFLVIHGGGLRTRDKADENVAQLCEVLATRGFVCVSINYRMTPDQPLDASGNPIDVLRAATQDAARAATWLRDNAGAYRVDTTRIAIGGSSAGATLALHVAYGPANPKMRFAAVFSWSGLPSGAAALMNKGEPPLFIVHGTADTSVAPSEALALATRAKEIGVAYEIHLCEELGHTVPLDRRPAGTSLYDRLIAFLDGGPGRTSHQPESCPQ